MSDLTPRANAELVLHTIGIEDAPSRRSRQAAEDVLRLLEVFRAAQAYLAVPRNVERNEDGIYRADFRPQQEARKRLAEAVRDAS